MLAAWLAIALSSSTVEFLSSIGRIFRWTGVIWEEKIHFSDDIWKVYNDVSWNKHRRCESLNNVIGYSSLQT